MGDYSFFFALEQHVRLSLALHKAECRNGSNCFACTEIEDLHTKLMNLTDAAAIRMGREL